MTIAIRRYVEPLSLASRERAAEIIESDAYRQVTSDLEAYVNGEIVGRSFLVAGHRGAGKTTMLRQAVQDVESRIRKRGAGAAHARPLFIALHGPDLLAPAKRAADADASPDPGATPPKSDAETASKKTKKAASAKTARAAEAAKKDSETPAVKSGATASAPPEPPPSEDLRHFLDRITSGLYVGAAQELALRFREHVLRTARSAAERADWLELAADLQVQLDRQPDLDRLRDYWRRVHALERGVLFEMAPHGGRGLAEVTALFSVGRAMRRFAGRTEASLASEASRTQSGEVSLVTIDGQNLLPPLIGLVTGVAIWSALPDGGDPMVKALTSLLTGFGAVLALKVTSRRTRGASQTWKETFIPDDDPGSLYRVLPGLIDRFRDFGLVPVFVVDELDKVPGLGEKINSLLGYMKQFVTERAFFCFVTNRSFYQQATAQAATGAYSTLHTRFGDSVFVRYDPEDFHKYLHAVLYVPDTVVDADQIRKAQDAAEMLRYKLLCRSYLHPYDLRRELAQLQNSDGTMIFTDDELIGSGRLQREVAAQVAVEIVYQSPELREYVRDPVTAQTVLDALYYPIRVWRNGQNEIDLTQEGLTKHLIERTGIAEEGAGAVSEEQLVPDSLQRLLLKQVEKVMGFLCAPDTLPQAAQDIKYELSETMKTMLARLEPIAEKVSG